MDDKEITRNIDDESAKVTEQQTPAPEKKKKGKGCLIAFLVVVGIIAAIVIALMIMVSKVSQEMPETSEQKSPTWAIYMYLCGSDLESEDGSAIANLANFNSDYMPDNLTLVLETGGAKKWNDQLFSSEKIQRFTSTKKDGGYIERQSLPQANMGEKETFQDFLKFCKENYPADNTMLIIWDHGGGPYYGVCLDENFPNTKLLQINEIAEALDATFGKKSSDTLLDIINFDCCNMGAIETAYLLKDYASYLIASEERIPGDGENYPAMVADIKNNPAITPLEFAKSVIVNYGKMYEEQNKGTTTLSAIDLSKIENVNDKLTAFTGSLIKNIYNDPISFTDLTIAINSAESFGSNFRANNIYDNLIDVKDFAKSAGKESTEAKELINAVDEAVIENYCGADHEGASGLSVFYALKPQDADFKAMEKLEPNVGVRALNELHAIGTVSEEGKNFITSLGKDPNVIPNLKTFKTVDIQESYVGKKNSDGKVYVDFGPEVGSCVTNALSSLYVKQNGVYYRLGTDDELNCKWNEGIFVHEAGGQWLQIGQWMASATLVYDSDEYNIYSIPFMFPDNENTVYALLEKYDFEEEAWIELGYNKVTNEPVQNRAASLQDGQEIVILQEYLDEENYIQYMKVGTEKYSSDLIRYASLPDGEYLSNIFVEDVHREKLYSDPFWFTVKDGIITYQ